MRVKENVYLHPESEGLKLVLGIDSFKEELNESIVLAMWLDGKNNLYWAKDNYRKNTPFKFVKEINKLTKDTLYNFNLMLKNDIKLNYDNKCKIKSILNKIDDK